MAFGKDEMLSILTGEPIEAPLSEPNRLRKTASSSLVMHALFLVAIVVVPYLTSMLWPAPPAPEREFDPPSLVFLVEEGPGGGGGGSSDDSEEPPSVQKIAGEDEAVVAVKVEDDALVFDDPDEPNEPEEEEAEEEEETIVAEVDAPVLEMRPDDFDQIGVLDGLEQAMAAAGSGEGTGIGDGRGSGIGEGTGGGFGGGAYQMGSGITPPQLRKQVDPTYTNNALSRKIEGVVVLEVVIMAEGRVGEARVLQSLDGELDLKAIEAVRQWVFIPGKMKGKPVDVIAQIEVQFSLL